MLLFVIWSILKLIEFWPSGLDFLKSGVWKDLGHPEKNCLGLLCEIVHFIVKQYTHVIPLETQRTQTLELVGGGPWGEYSACGEGGVTWQIT